MKVANVPIVPEVDPPEELFTVDPAKCIGLKINPDKLNDIRRERLKALGLGDQAIYANIKRIHQELDYFDRVINRIGCRVVDVSNRSEERRVGKECIYRYAGWCERKKEKEHSKQSR